MANHWKTKIDNFMKRNGLEPCSDIFECSRRLEEAGIAKIGQHDSYGEIKKRLCKTVKGFNKNQIKEKKVIVTRDQKKKCRDSRKARRFKKRVFRHYGKKCVKCGSTENVTVDHIFPVAQYPEKAFDLDNTQPLCNSCNEEKADRIIDFRVNMPCNTQS